MNFYNLHTFVVKFSCRELRKFFCDFFRLKNRRSATFFAFIMYEGTVTINAR